MRFLPVFLDLQSGKVLLVGAGDLARAKLRLLAAAGASIRWFATDGNHDVDGLQARDMARIELRGVTKSDKRDAIEIPVLENVSITVDGGDFLGLMGPSGSGKSTLVNLLAGIDRPSRGSVRIGDTVVASCTVREVNEEKRRVTFDCACRVGDTVVLDGEAVVMAPARPKA